MARYAVAADLLPVLPQYLRTQILDDNHDGTEDPGLAESLLEYACDYIDGAIQAAGFAVPVAAPIPSIVSSLTLQIARYAAHERLNLVDDRVRQQWEWVREDLKALADGSLAIGLTPTPAAAVAGSAPWMSSDERALSRAKSALW